MLIKYENLTIRDAVATDTEQLFAWYNDGNIMAQFGYPDGMGLEYKPPEEISQGIAENTENTDDDHLHIIELDGKPIGEMNYRSFCYPDGMIECDGKPIDETIYRNMERAIEPGIKICDISARDKGYGTKLLTMFIDALFRYHGFQKIILDTDKKNERAQHVYEKKLGFRFLGTHRDLSLDESEYYASVVYFEMDKADWLASRKEPVEYTHMSILYKQMDEKILSQIDDVFGEGTRRHIPVREDGFTLAAVDGDMPVGFICVNPRALTCPLEHIKDAYIEIYEVHENYRRQGIGRHLVACGEKWAKQQGFRQIRTHHNDQAVAAINMSLALGFGMCPHVYSKEEGCSGYHVAKILSP